MTWWAKNSCIPDNDESFSKLIKYFVIECPVCREKKIKDVKTADGKTKYIVTKNPISARNSTFRSRNVSGNLLTTLMAQIRRPLAAKSSYALLKNKELVENKVNEIIAHSNQRDENFELVVFQNRTDMSDVEAFYYYIRNAFAHGSFEILLSRSGRIYKLESSKDGEIKAQMRLKESSLMKYVDYSKYDVKTIKTLQNKRTKA